MYDLEGILAKIESDAAYDLSGLGSAGHNSLARLGLGGLSGYDDDFLEGILGAAKQVKNAYPSISSNHAVQVSRARRGLPVDEGTTDLQFMEFFSTKQLSASNSTQTTPVDFFTGTQAFGVTNARLGLIGGSDETGIVESVGVQLIHGSFTESTGAITAGTNTFSYADVAAFKAHMDGLNYLVNFGELVIFQRNREKFRAKLAECLFGSGINVQIAIGGTIATGGILCNTQIGEPSPINRQKLPQPILLLPDLPIKAQIVCPNAVALGTGNNVTATVALTGRKVVSGGVGR